MKMTQCWTDPRTMYSFVRLDDGSIWKRSELEMVNWDTDRIKTIAACSVVLDDAWRNRLSVGIFTLTGAGFVRIDEAETPT